MIDFPAPVSPVSTPKPGASSISSCSMVAKFVTLRSLSMAMSETQPFRAMPFGLPGWNRTGDWPTSGYGTWLNRWKNLHPLRRCGKHIGE